MNKKVKFKESYLGYLLLAPSIILLVLLIGYPMVNNFFISFYDVPLNPKLESTWVGLQNFIEVLTDPEFLSSLAVTIGFTILVVILSTIIGLGVALLFNRKFMFKKTIMSLVILPYIVPSIALIFAWKYLFNNTYGIINYILVDVLHLLKTAPLWFDNKISAFILVVLFNTWRFFPYAYISFYAILQTIDKSLYEAAEIDGANVWRKFLNITLPEITPVLVTVVTLRTIWVFYMFSEVYLLTKQVNIIGVYLYEIAFAVRDFGKAAAVSIILFAIIFAFILAIRKKVFKVES